MVCLYISQTIEQEDIEYGVFMYCTRRRTETDNSFGGGVEERLDKLEKLIGSTDISELRQNTITGSIALLDELVGNTVKPLFMYCDDLDNPPQAYIVQTGTKPVGYPTNLGGNSCIVIQQNPGTIYTVQLAFGFGSDRIAIRRKAGTNTFTEWHYFSATS